MESPEYNALMKQLTRLRLTGIARETRGMGKQIEEEIRNFKHIVHENEIAPEICAQLLDELLNPNKGGDVSSPLKNIYQETEKLPDAPEELREKDTFPKALNALSDGRGVMIRGNAGRDKYDLAMAACAQYKQEHPEYQKIYLLERACSKRTSDMELCFGRRTHMDNRVQLGYIAEGLILAQEQPQALVVLILDDVDTIDIIHTMAGLWKLLERKGTDELVGHDLILHNSRNFLLFALDNMENNGRNVSMDNLGIKQVFQEIVIWNPQFEKLFGKLQ